MAILYVNSPMDDEPLLHATQFEDNDDKHTGDIHICEILSGVFSCDADTTPREQVNDGIAIAHLSFASKRSQGGKHRSSNARAPNIRAANKVQYRFAKLPPTRLIETRMRLTSNSDTFVLLNAATTNDFSVGLTHAMSPSASSTDHSLGRCAMRSEFSNATSTSS